MMASWQCQTSGTIVTNLVTQLTAFTSCCSSCAVYRTAALPVLAGLAVIEGVSTHSTTARILGEKLDDAGPVACQHYSNDLAMMRL